MTLFAARAIGRWARGQSLVELAISLPVLVLLFLAAADFGRLFYMWIAVNNAARAGAQYGSQTLVTAANSASMIQAAKDDGSNITGLCTASYPCSASQCTCVTGTPVPV